MIKKLICSFVWFLVALVAFAQHRDDNSSSNALEPLLPFETAIMKAKAKDPQGYYALAIHYAKGNAVKQNTIMARKFLQKAHDANYGNAILAYTLLLELESLRDLEYKINQQKWMIENHPCSRFEGYTSTYENSFYDRNAPVLSFTNEAHIASIRTGYIRAAQYGCSPATNELARFEKLSLDALSDAKSRTEADERKAKNAKLVEGLL